MAKKENKEIEEMSLLELSQLLEVVDKLNSEYDSYLYRFRGVDINKHPELVTNYDKQVMDKHFKSNILKDKIRALIEKKLENYYVEKD